MTPAAGVAGASLSLTCRGGLRQRAVLTIALGHEADFLAPLSVDLLPLTEAMAAPAAPVGHSYLGAIGDPAGQCCFESVRDGGPALHQWAQGHDNRRVVSRPPPPLESVTRQFDGPIVDRTTLETLLAAMAAELSTRLRNNGLASRQVQLTLAFEDRTTQQKQLIVRHPTANPERLAQIFKELLAKARIRAGVLEMGWCWTDLVPAVGRQLDLFAQRRGAGQPACARR